jgi:hypothetical protein
MNASMNSAHSRLQAVVAAVAAVCVSLLLLSGVASLAELSAPQLLAQQAPATAPVQA